MNGQPVGFQMERNMTRREMKLRIRGVSGHGGLEERDRFRFRNLAIGMVLVVAWGCSMKASKPESKLPVRIPSLAQSEKAVLEFEAMESSGRAFFDAPPEMRNEEANRAIDRIREALEEIDAYLGSAPGDPRALLLKARALRALDVANPKQFTMGPEGKPVVSGTSHIPEIQGLLEEVLAREPGNASAHYWKARISALQEPTIEEGQFAFKGGDVEQVLFHAEKAVALAPENIVYREYCAQALLAVGRQEESMALMKNVAGGNHPIYRLQQDWKLIPLPEGAMIDPIMTMSMIQMLQESEERGNYPNLRVAVFVVPRSAEEVQRFYASRFGPLKRTKDLGAGMTPVALEWKGEDLVQGEMPAKEDDDRFSGVLLMIAEGPPQQNREAVQVPEGGSSSRLYVNNMRRFLGP